MINVLITGKDSYVGTSFIKYSNKLGLDFHITELKTRQGEWKKFDFSGYDTVFHVAGIAHNSADVRLKKLYYEVNEDLTIEIARKAKNSGVKQFIFMSSMIVYGNEKNGKTIINKNSKLNPDNFYGDSKLKAEEGLTTLNDEKFKVVILRPPMLYGKDSKGNYPLLSKLARKTPIFPNYPNKRSMLYIENLCEFIRLMIVNKESGIFHPQNSELVQTSKMVNLISSRYKKKIWFVRFFNPIIDILFRIKLIQKVFGDLYYESSMSEYSNGDYQIYNLRESIELTEGD